MNQMKKPEKEQNLWKPIPLLYNLREIEREREPTLQLGADPCCIVANAFQCEIPKQQCFLETLKWPSCIGFGKNSWKRKQKICFQENRQN